MIKVFTFDFYALLDVGASLSFVSPYDTMNFNVLPKNLLETFNVYTHGGESILVEIVYLYCTIYVNHKRSMDDLLQLDMVDFDVILGVD